MNDLEIYARMGQVLLGSSSSGPRRSELQDLSQLSLHILTAATLHPSRKNSFEEGDASEWVDRAAAGLVDRAHKRGSSGFKGHLLHPFFRLQPEVRLILVGLHVGRWSYARLVRILSVPGQVLHQVVDPVLELQKIAWDARIRIATETGVISYPVAPVRHQDCPPYLLDAPWTQKFLDDEIQSGSERVILQSHLLNCDSCAQSLAKSRALYYRVDAVIQSTLDQLENEMESEGGMAYTRQAQDFEESLKAGQQTCKPNPWKGVAAVLRKPDVVVLLIFCGVLTLIWFMRH